MARQLKDASKLRIVSVQAVNVASQAEADELLARFNGVRRRLGATTDLVATEPPLIKLATES